MGQLLTELGADHVVALASGWAARAREITGGAGVGYLLDPVGGPASDDAVRGLAVAGTLLVVGSPPERSPRSQSTGCCCAMWLSPASSGANSPLHRAAFAESMTGLDGLVGRGLRSLLSAGDLLRSDGEHCSPAGTPGRADRVVCNHRASRLPRAVRIGGLSARNRRRHEPRGRSQKILRISFRARSV